MYSEDYRRSNLLNRFKDITHALYARSNLLVLVVHIDVLDYDAYPAVVSWVSDTLLVDAKCRGLNVLINNAAIAHWEPDCELDLVSRDILVSEYETNAVAPLLLTRVGETASCRLYRPKLMSYNCSDMHTI